MTTRYVIIKAQIIGTPENWTYQYWSDLKPFEDRVAAVAHGIELLGHDDFCIGTVVDGQLVAYGWGADDFAPEDRDDLTSIADQIELHLADWVRSARGEI